MNPNPPPSNMNLYYNNISCNKIILYQQLSLFSSFISFMSNKNLSAKIIIHSNITL